MTNMYDKYVRRFLTDEIMDFSAQNPATSNALSLAARQNDVNNVARLLQSLNPNCVDNRGWTSLHEAAYFDSYDSMLLLLKAPRIRPRAETHEGHTALYLACKNCCSIKTIKALLDAVRNIANYGSTEGVTPLHIAATQGNVELIQLLLEYNAIINVQDFDGDTPLHEAALAGQHKALITLLYAGADPEITNSPGGFTPFHLACCKGYFPNIESLLPFVYDINQQTSTGDTALHYAVYGACGIDVLNYLLDNGADPNIMNSSKEMPIDLALNSNAEVFKKLLLATDRQKINKNLVVNACKPHMFKFDILEILLYSDLGPDFFNVDRQFNAHVSRGCLTRTTYLTHAPLNSYLYVSAYIYKKSPEKFREFFYLYLMQGVSVNSISATECPPLVYAHYVYHTDHLQHACFKEVFEILIENGCDVDFCSSGKSLCPDVDISDPFLTALDIYPLSVPLMMPYSLYNEPEHCLQFAIKKDLIGVIPMQVQHELMSMIDKNYHSMKPELFEYYVPSLKHLCRSTFRSFLKSRPYYDNGVVTKHTTATFLTVMNSLPVPPMIKNYLRYI